MDIVIANGIDDEEEEEEEPTPDVGLLQNLNYGEIITYFHIFSFNSDLGKNFI